MSDPIFHSVEQKSFSELRDEFREANRQRIHRMLREDEIVIRDKSGIEVARKKTGYLTDAAPGHEHRRLDDYRRAGGEFGVSDEFKVIEGPGLDRELRDLARDVKLIEQSEAVVHTDVPPMAPTLDSLDEVAVLDYTSSLVELNKGPVVLPSCVKSVHTDSHDSAPRAIEENDGQ